MTKYQAEYEIYIEAITAAKEATEKMIRENPDTWYPCGFSWARIKPARGRFVLMLKEIGACTSDAYDGGVQVYNPSGNHTQWMDAKYAGSIAFRDVLHKYGIPCFAVQRID